MSHREEMHERELQGVGHVERHERGAAEAPGGGTAEAPGFGPVLEALPCPTLLVDPGAGRVCFANRAAVAAGFPPDGPVAQCESRCFADAEGGPFPRGQDPLSRAGRGEVFEAVRLFWQAPTARKAFVVSSQRAGESEGGAARLVLHFADAELLQETEAELRQSLRARDDFVSVATHELKEPLSALLLSLQLLESKAAQPVAPPRDELLAGLRVMRRQGNRLSRLIENLLDVSRIYNNRLHLDPEAVDLAELAGEVVARFREEGKPFGPGAPPASGITLDPSAPIIGYFDRLRLDQVISNLLSNALKYGNGKPVTVRVWADASRAFLQVVDLGVGIAPEDRGRIFERFERAAVEHRRHSLGLGLYIVRCIVEAHGGTIRVQSGIGKGSTFTMQLPRRRLPERGGDAAGEPARGGREPASGGREPASGGQRGEE